MGLFGKSYQEKIETIDAHLAQGGTIPLNRPGSNPHVIVRGNGNTYVREDAYTVGLSDDEIDAAYRYAKRHPVAPRPKG